MSKQTEKPKTPKITFSRDGLIPAVAGMTCAMSKDGVFTSAHLSKCIQLVYSNLLCAEFLEVEELVVAATNRSNIEHVPDLYAEQFGLHGQSLKNLRSYWSTKQLWEEKGGAGKKTKYHITTKGLRSFMRTIMECRQGLNELRFDFILLSIYTIRAVPISMLVEVSPELAREIDCSKQVDLKWDWTTARDTYIHTLEEKRKSLENRAEKTAQLSGVVSKQAKALVAGTALSMTLLPGLRASLPILGLLAFRSQRDRKWFEGPNLLRNVYQMWRPSYAEYDAKEGMELRTTSLYTPMAENIGQMIRSLERLK